MKRLILVLLSLLIFTLTSCIPEEEKLLDYSDFPNSIITTYEEAETISENKYIVYYYSSNCGHCASIKQELLTFLSTFDTLPFYLFNISDARNIDVSSLPEFSGTPTMFVMSDNQVFEYYVGADKVIEFTHRYDDIILDYSSFSSQHLTKYQDVLNIDRDSYILYYYLDVCPHCNLVKDNLLEWAFTKSAEDIYFMNGANVQDPDNIPTELTILKSGTPILLVMSNGVFTDEYYSGSEDLLEYLLEIGEDGLSLLD